MKIYAVSLRLVMLNRHIKNVGQNFIVAYRGSGIPCGSNESKAHAIDVSINFTSFATI